MSSPQITTRINQQGDEEIGYWEEIDVTNNEGQPTGEKINRWVPQPIQAPALKTLGNDYETNGPTGAPKILALLHIVSQDSSIVRAGSAVANSLVLSFYRLTKCEDDVNKLNRQYTHQRDAVSQEVRTVIRWKYVQLFINMFEDEITGQTDNKVSGRTVLEFGSDQTVFNPEYIFSKNWNVLGRSVGPAVALISFDEDESKRITDVTVLREQFPNNKDGISWIVPVKLLNPKCIHVGTNYRDNGCSLFHGFDGFDEEKNIMRATIEDIVRKHTETKQKKDTLEGEIEKIESKHEAEIQKINDQQLNYLDKFRKERQVKKYKKTTEYSDDLETIKNKKDEIDKNNRHLIQLVNQYNQEKAKLAEIDRKKPIVYYGVLLDINRSIRFFIDPQFSEASLVNLVYQECMKSKSGGKRRNNNKNNCYLKFRKTKRKNAKPLRKNTKKYYRRSNRK